MEGLFPLSRMVAGRRVFGKEGNVLPSTSSMITGMKMLPMEGRISLLPQWGFLWPCRGVSESTGRRKVFLPGSRQWGKDPIGPAGRMY